MSQYWKILRNLSKPSIGRNFALRILLFSSVITLIFTILQLTLEFNRDVRDIEGQLKQIKESYSKSLASSLWIVDQTGVQLQLEGMHRLPDMQYLEVVSENNKQVAQIGKPEVSRILRLETPLYFTHRDQQMYVGKLITVATLNGAYQRLEDKAIVILMTQFAKTFIVSVFIIFLFQWLVGRYLNQIADYSRKLRAHDLEQPLVLNRADVASSNEDELQQVVSAINSMRINLQNSTLSLHESEKQLSKVMTVTGEGIWDWDVAADVVSHNMRWCELLGLGEDYLRHSRAQFENILHEDDRKTVIERIEACFNGAGPYRSEHRMCRADGSIMWVLDRGDVSERDQQGRPLRLLGSIADISERKYADVALNESREYLRAMFESSPVGLALCKMDGTLVDVNDAYAKIVGRSVEALMGLTYWEMTPAVYAEGEKLLLHNLQQYGRYGPFEKEYIHQDGHLVPVRLNGLIIRRNDTDYIWSSVEDLSAQKESDESMRLAELVYQNSSEAVMVTDANNLIIAINPAFSQITGYSLEEVLGRHPQEFSSGRHDSGFFNDMWQEINNTGHWQGEIWDKRKDGILLAKHLTINTINNADGSVDRYVALFSDITAKKHSDELIWNQANYDSLTGLPNRNMFRDRLSQEMAKTMRGTTKLGLLLIDLDQFKEVNDTLGHSVGDVLLQEASRRIRATVRDVDTVARLGGDEFTVILSEQTDVGNLDKVANKLVASLAEPYTLENEIIHISASIGISLYPDDASEISSLMKNADQAMYAAKRQGRNRYSYFTREMQEAAQYRLRLSNDMRLALEREEFILHYQPQVNLESGRVTGVEALVRWQHPTKGMLSPAVFIPIAEDTDLILPLGAWVMRTACLQLKQWTLRGMTDMMMSVNLSARQLRQKKLPDIIKVILEETEIDPDSLELEITESLAMDNPVENAKTIAMLRSLGLKVAMDDFGTGHSSLGYLKDFPITRLKLDRSFIINIETEPNDAIIVAAAIDLSHELGLDVVAEGVESERQVEYLARLNCDTIQGYYFSKPLAAIEVENYIGKRNQPASRRADQTAPVVDVLIIDDDEWICKFLADTYSVMGHRPITETDPLKGLEILQQAPDKFSLILVDMLLPNMSGINLVREIRKINRDATIIVVTSHRTEAVRSTFKPIEKEFNLLPGVNFFVLEKPVTAESIIHLTEKLIRHPV